MKKRIGAFLVIFMALSMLCGITAFAVYKSPRYSYTRSAFSTLSFNGSTATCTSKLTGMTGVTGVSGTQYLEKKNGSDWEVVPYCNWFRMDTKSTLNIENTKKDLDHGTYRVRAEFTVYSGSDTEPVQAISNEVTY